MTTDTQASTATADGLLRRISRTVADQMHDGETRFRRISEPVDALVLAAAASPRSDLKGAHV
jgi:hypothetical protein